MTLSHLVIQHGHIFGGEGGAILNRGLLTLNRVSILSSTSTFSGSLMGQGGGISNYGTLFVLNSVVRGNTAATSVNLPTDSLGGGIYNYVLQTVLLSNSQVLNNNVFMTNTSGFGTGLAAGGGIYNIGTVTLTHSSVSSNTVSSSGLANAQGGGFYQNQTGGSVLLVDSHVEGNRLFANGVVGDPSTEGGGLYVLSGTMTLLRMSIGGNMAGYG